MERVYTGNVDFAGEFAYAASTRAYGFSGRTHDAVPASYVGHYHNRYTNNADISFHAEAYDKRNDSTNSEGILWLKLQLPM